MARIGRMRGLVDSINRHHLTGTTIPTSDGIIRGTKLVSDIEFGKNEKVRKRMSAFVRMKAFAQVRDRYKDREWVIEYMRAYADMLEEKAGSGDSLAANPEDINVELTTPTDNERSDQTRTRATEQREEPHTSRDCAR